MMMGLLKGVRGIAVLLFLTFGVFFANFVQMLSVVLLLVGQRKFMLFNIGVKSVYCSTLARCSYLCGNRIIVTGDQPRAENAIVMANHQSYLDIPLIWMWALPMGTIGWMKWFVKDEFKYMPGLGWGLKFAHALFVKRDWSRDADSIKATFASILNADIPFWVAIFPEGTRMKPGKYLQSRAYSRRKGSHIFDRVLFPRPKGAWSTLQGLRGKLKAVYDITIAFTAEPPSVIKFYCVGGYTTKLHIERFEVSELATSERDFNQWMQARFIQKDQWLALNSGRPPFKCEDLS